MPYRTVEELPQAQTDQYNAHQKKAFLEAFNAHDPVRTGIAGRFEGIPDVHYGEDRHWACGNFVVRKDSFWKIRE